MFGMEPHGDIGQEHGMYKASLKVDTWAVSKSLLHAELEHFVKKLAFGCMV